MSDSTFFGFVTYDEAAAVAKQQCQEYAEKQEVFIKEVIVPAFNTEVDKYFVLAKDESSEGFTVSFKMSTDETVFSPAAQPLVSEALLKAGWSIGKFDHSGNGDMEFRVTKAKAESPLTSVMAKVHKGGIDTV